VATRSDPGEASFSVEGLTFTDVTALGKSGAQSKAGQLTWRANLEGNPVKISEYPSEGTARLLHVVSADPGLTRYFPRVVIRLGRHVVADWIEGKAVTALDVARDYGMLAEIASIQAQIHAFRVPAELRSTSPSYRMILEARFTKYAGILPLECFGDRVRVSLDAAERRLSPVLSHPDLTPANLIRDAGTGHLMVVDNELIASHRFPHVDLLNTYRALGADDDGDLASRYLAAWRTVGGDPRPLVSEAEAYEALWALRVVGSSLQRGLLAEALPTAEAYLAGRSPAHPLIRGSS